MTDTKDQKIIVAVAEDLRRLASEAEDFLNTTSAAGPIEEVHLLKEGFQTFTTRLKLMRLRLVETLGNDSR